MLRIAFLANPNETHAHRWLRWFAERGHGVYLVAPSDIELEAVSYTHLTLPTN